MKLIYFRVKNYRSFVDSSWIQVSDFTTIIGACESGKSNLLTALWKLNPAARAGRVRPDQDLPKSIYDTYIDAEEKPDFVEGIYALDEDAKAIVAENFPQAKQLERIYVARDFNGTIKIALSAQYESAEVEALTLPLLAKLPKMIYSANYGNLDSNVYLPSILRRFNRFGYNAASKTMSRSLRIILSYLGISSTRLLKEIRLLKGDKTIKKIYAADIKMAIDAKADYYNPLITEGCRRLSDDFSQYWKQNRINVDIEFTDKELKFWIMDENGDKIELQNHSVGLQWFLSFFLIFTVELKNLYANTILIFDEGGMALKPEAHQNLAEFMSKMAEINQIVVSTSTPNIVAATNLDKVRVVYRDKFNHSVVSNNLDMNADKTNALSMQVVFNSFGLSLSSMRFAACVPVLVTETSDQYYLDMIKGYLLAGGWIFNAKEIMFIPCGNGGMDKAARLLTSIENTPPYVILPCTERGKAFYQELMNGYYKEFPYRVLMLKLNTVNAEGLVPFKWFYESSMDYIRSITGSNFVLMKNRNIIEQIEQYAVANNLILPNDYRIQIAQRVKLYEVKKYPHVKMSHVRFDTWKNLFSFLKKI